MEIIIKKEDILKNKIIELSKKPKILLIFNGKDYFAFNGICPHARWPLDIGTLDKTTLTCVAHGYEFDITNGGCLNNPGRDLKMYDIQNDDDKIIVKTK
jgi:toluene monooxygenase system ferredoxin subunit